MNIIFEGPELKLETQGHGLLVCGQTRSIDPEYAYDLIVSARVRPADDASRQEYVAMRERKIAAAAATGGSVYCDRCQHEGAAIEHRDGFCPTCNPRPIDGPTEGKE